MQVLEQTHQLSKERAKALVIVGEVKSGKSTFRHFLVGNTLTHQHNQELGFYELKSDTLEDA